MLSMNRQRDIAPFPHKYLTGIADLSAADITRILDRAQSFADDLAEGHFESNLLSGRVVVNIFFENSTRTRTSFEMGRAETRRKRDQLGRKNQLDVQG